MRPPPTPRPRCGRSRPRAPTPHSCGAGPPEPGLHPALAARQQPSEVSLHAAANKARPAPLGVPRFGPPRGTGLRAHRSPHPSWMTAGWIAAPRDKRGHSRKDPPLGMPPQGWPSPFAPPPFPAFWARWGFPPAAPSPPGPAAAQLDGGMDVSRVGAAGWARSSAATSPSILRDGDSQSSECRRVPEVLTSCSRGSKRIQLDGSRLGADGHHTQDGVVGQGAGLAGEAVLHRLPWGQAGQSGTSHL